MTKSFKSEIRRPKAERSPKAEIRMSIESPQAQVRAIEELLAGHLAQTQRNGMQETAGSGIARFKVRKMGC
jgi:hypothetical protein